MLAFRSLVDLLLMKRRLQSSKFWKHLTLEHEKYQCRCIWSSNANVQSSRNNNSQYMCIEALSEFGVSVLASLTTDTNIFTMCDRFAVELMAQSQASDDMDTDTRPHLYVEEYEKMRNCGSTTMSLDFSHIMQHDNTLQAAISEQYLRYVYAPSFSFQGSPSFNILNSCFFSKPNVAGIFWICPDSLWSLEQV